MASPYNALLDSIINARIYLPDLTKTRLILKIADEIAYAPDVAHELSSQSSNDGSSASSESNELSNQNSTIEEPEQEKSSRKRELKQPDRLPLDLEQEGWVFSDHKVNHISGGEFVKVKKEVWERTQIRIRELIGELEQLSEDLADVHCFEHISD